MIARGLVSMALLACLIRPAAAESTDANLITAIDVSGSIDMAEERLELDGIAQAVVDARFLQAIARGYHGKIGFTVFTWANGEFVPLVPWTLISSKADAERVAELLRQVRTVPSMGHAAPEPRQRRPWRSGYATDVSGAIERAIEISADAPFTSWHTVVNICANGIDNVGDGPIRARDRAAGQGLIVNGVVLGEREEAGDIAAWFREQVQAGPGSFVIEARQFADVTRAMLAKFVVELAAVSGGHDLRARGMRRDQAASRSVQASLSRCQACQ